MKRWSLVLICLFQFTWAVAQSEADTIVIAQGRILNSATKEPIKAKITYQSLPYGSVTGVINNDAYSFQLFDREKYSIRVEAPGYKAAKYLLDPAEATQNRINRDIELEAGSDSNDDGLKDGTVFVLQNLIFEVGKFKISPESFEELDRVVVMMNNNPRMIIQLEGHTDFQGPPKDNMKLSENRVAAVKEYLINKGVAKSRVRTVAFGGTKPLNTANTPEAHRMNRRVELRILKRN